MTLTRSDANRTTPAGWASATLLCLLSACGALTQKSDEVYIRPPGDRTLQGPAPASVEAEKHWQFAMLSQAAYGRIPAVKDAPVATATPDATSRLQSGTGQAVATCEDVDGVLLNAGWTPWYDFPDVELSKKIANSNLRVEVWERKDPPAVTVTFGGTVFTSGKDWKSNLRWFIPDHNDEYTDLVNVFGPAFVAEFSRRANKPEGAYLKSATIYSTGHSLGGGLAQQFAYSMPIAADVQRVSQVYAFDPSPVTGFYSVDPATRDNNKRGLRIDRTYERGEILAILRALMSLIYPPTEEDPAIRGV